VWLVDGWMDGGGWCVGVGRAVRLVVRVCVADGSARTLELCLT